jgi:uncharacterized protein
MSPIAFDPSISPVMHKTILDRLRQIEATENVRILFAIESGSRAWGFPSPDSDYDARFVYARPRDWYLSLAPGRDVIELPIVDDLDINGWDIKKALNLLLKANPVLLEWLSSPIRYLWNEAECARLQCFAERIAHGPACRHHYFNLGESLWKRHIADKAAVNLKKYFYIVRPAMALRWIRMHPHVRPPMNFQELLTGIDLSEPLTNALETLLIAKSRSKELGLAPRVPVIDEFVEAEFEAARNARQSSPDQPDLRADADALFRAIIEGQG